MEFFWSINFQCIRSFPNYNFSVGRKYIFLHERERENNRRRKLNCCCQVVHTYLDCTIQICAVFCSARLFLQRLQAAGMSFYHLCPECTLLSDSVVLGWTLFESSKFGLSRFKNRSLVLPACSASSKFRNSRFDPTLVQDSYIIIESTAATTSQNIWVHVQYKT